MTIPIAIALWFCLSQHAYSAPEMIKSSLLLALQVRHTAEQDTASHDCQLVCYADRTDCGLLFDELLYSLIRLVQCELEVLI